MKPPVKLYRYRPLDDVRLNRELKALQESYLFSSRFSEMNDPMEAFYETGGPGDRIIDAMFAPAGKSTKEIYQMLSEMIDSFALVSFASSNEDLPMWAYYGSNFAGMCLEFDTAELMIGDFRGQQLVPVTYARSALPPLTFADLGTKHLAEAVIARITRKRSEWAHEKEWRFVTGQAGPMYYLDDALRRVFLGPKVKPEHAEKVCEMLERRPVEVLQGETKGFELVFRSIQPALALEKCERVGIGKFDFTEHLYAQEDLSRFLVVPYTVLFEECRRTALRPNMEEFAGIDLAGSDKNAMYIWTSYKLRNGRAVYQKRYFDSHFRKILE